MSKLFRARKIDEPLFLPPTVQDFVARDHLTHFVLRLIKDDLDLAEITGTYGSERGQPPFDPTMMCPALAPAAASGHAAAAPPRTPRNSRRLMPSPMLKTRHRNGSNEDFDRCRNLFRYCNMRCGPRSVQGHSHHLRVIRMSASAE